jgi:hypothetical protein
VNADQGVIYVLMEHFTRHLHPRAVAIERELDAGRRLTDAQIDHISQVLEEFKLLRPLIERHPEQRDLAGGVAALYTSIARRALQNETAGPS